MKNSKIFFSNLKELAEFLESYCGTSVFCVYKCEGGWVMEFTEGL
jgi:hypothetical protein